MPCHWLFFVGSLLHGGEQERPQAAGHEVAPAEPLYFSASVDGNVDIWCFAGGETRRVTRHPAPDNLPRPSPDGAWLTFQSQRDGSYDVSVMPSDGSAPPRKVASGPDHDGLPVWSPDGSEIAFFSSRDLPRPDPRSLSGHVYRVRLDGSGLRRVTAEPLRSTTGPSAWDPGGEWLLLGRRRESSGLDLVQLDLATGAERALSADPRDEYGAELSPDAGRVAFHAEGEGRCDLVVMQLDGTERRVLTREPGLHYVQSWSADGRWLAVLSYTADFASSRTYALRVADGHEQPIAIVDGARDLAWARR